MQKKIKLSSINDYIEFLLIIDKDKEIKIEMSIVRDDLYEIQILYNSLPNKNNVFNTDKNEIAIMLLIFTKRLEDRGALLKRFEDSHIYQKTDKLDEKKLKDRYVLKIKKDWNLLRDTINHIIYDIYKYKNDETYEVLFVKIENNKPYVINGIKISYIDYLFNRNKWKVFSNVK